MKNISAHLKPGFRICEDIYFDGVQLIIDFTIESQPGTYRVKLPHPLDADKDNGFLCHAPFVSIDLLYKYYRLGLFPWFNMGASAALFFPAKRYIIRPEVIKIQKSLRSYFNQEKFTITYDKCFDKVISACAAIERRGEVGTWISEEFIDLYSRLHKAGHAHSVEVWMNGELAGGLYGVVVGKIFCGESMFSYEKNASKLALISLADYLAKRNFLWIDCQIKNDYLTQFGGEEMDSKTYYNEVIKNTKTYGDMDYFSN